MNERLKDFLSQKIHNEPIQKSFLNNLKFRLVKDEFTAGKSDFYRSLAYTLRDRLANQWLITQREHHGKDTKRIYYFSLEFLMGRLLKMNIDNLNLLDDVKELFMTLGLTSEQIEEVERDPGLGNGGLGRLAACFLDSIATLQIPCFGYGIRYDYGLFRQKIVNGYQVELPDDWLTDGNPWEIERPERFTIQFYGNVRRIISSEGTEKVEWVNTNNLMAIPYDTPIPGFANGTVNTLRLWSAKSDEEFRLQFFNNGEYIKAYQDKIIDENVTKILYPNDNTSVGLELRLKQEFFFCSASLQDIIRRYKEDHASDFSKFSDKVAIQLNDTHPSISIPELMRLLIDINGLSYETAWEITQKTFAYTNHTLMPEALEKWPEWLVAKILPRHLEIIYWINAKFMEKISILYKGDIKKMADMSIIEEGQEKKVRMAYLAIVSSFSVNGVAALHSELLKTDLLPNFYAVFPEKFNNKTNGITHRRWLLQANPRLANLITSKIDAQWLINLEELKRLEEHQNDQNFKEGWQIIKHNNKADFCRYLEGKYGFIVDPHSLFDVQVKRIHEYKRQLLNIMHVIYLYLEIKNNPNKTFAPRTVFIGGKAAPAYHMAKLHIKLINSVSAIINNDTQVCDKLRLYFVPEYNVSLAERIIPAADLSEQISTAGREASGTGNMKFSLNGALTIGTLDGANIEIMEHVGKDNIFIFGLTSDDVKTIKNQGYNPRSYIEKSAHLQEILGLIKSGFFCPEQHDLFYPIFDSLVYNDPFLVLADFDAYIACQNDVSTAYQNTGAWTQKAIINVANMGFFSSDRTIMEYNRDIWKIPPVPIDRY